MCSRPDPSHPEYTRPSNKNGVYVFPYHYEAFAEIAEKGGGAKILEINVWGRVHRSTKVWANGSVEVTEKSKDCGWAEQQQDNRPIKKKTYRTLKYEISLVTAHHFKHATIRIKLYNSRKNISVYIYSQAV